jgi:hypothetical protein
MSKRDALIIEKKIISQPSTTDTSLLPASYLISLQAAKCKKLYSIAEELIKPSLTVHVHVIYFSINLVQDMETVILIIIKRIQQHKIYIQA